MVIQARMHFIHSRSQMTMIGDLTDDSTKIINKCLFVLFVRCKNI